MQKNKFVENFFSLTALRGITLIVPLITFPYLIRVLGSESYGLVMWAWSIVNFFILFINFGFDLSVTKYVSINREKQKEISKIVSTAIATKFLLFFVATFLFVAIVFLMPKLSSHKELFFLTFALTFGETMMPIWYFQGIEQMKYTAIITSGIKILFTILVFLVIKNQDDYLKVPVLYAVASLASALFAYYLIFAKHKIVLVKPKLSEIIFYIKDASALFLSSSMSVLKDSLTIVFIERYIGLSAVAFFDIAQKFVNILLTPFHILATVIFPQMSKTKNFNFLKKVILYSTGVALILISLTYLFDKQIVTLLYGKSNETIETILPLLAISILFANIASLLGTNGLVVAHRNKKLLLSSLYGFMTYLILLFMAIIFTKISLIEVATIIVIAYIIDSLIRNWYIGDLLWKN